MPISQGDMVFSLVQSLTKAEKRNFKLYIRRLQHEGEVKFFRLFELMEKWETYNEAALRKQLNIRTPHQLSNLKRNLYLHILTSLRLIRIKQELDIQIRELINYAQILYGRGLYLQALRLLEKAKGKAREHHQDLLHLEIIEFEKRIESRHITRSTNKRMSDLIAESAGRSKVSSNIVEWSNLKLQLQRWFINHGHVRDQSERDKIAHEYSYCFSEVDLKNVTFFEKVHFFQARYWLHYLLLDMDTCRRIANSWVVLYLKAPKMVEEDVNSYLLALHCHLIAAYYLQDLSTFTATRKQLDAFVQKEGKKLDKNSQIQAFLFCRLAALDQNSIAGDYKASLALLPKFEEELRQFKKLLDPHKVHLFYYKMAWIYLANGQPDEAVIYLQKILNANLHLRDDILIYSRLLLLMTHFELNNLDLLEYLWSATSRRLKRAKQKNPLQKLCLRHFKKISTAGSLEAEERLKEFKSELKSLQRNPYLRRAFLYLDVPLWVESQIKGISMAEMKHRSAF